MSSTAGAGIGRGNRPGLPALVLAAVLMLGGLAFLAPALDWPFPLARVQFRAREAAFLFAGVGIVSLGLALRSAARAIRGNTPTPEDLVARWRRSRRFAPLAGALALAGFAVPLLDPVVGDYQVLRGGWLFWTSGAAWLLVAAALSWNPERAVRRQELDAGTALRGVAVIEEFEDTGWTINENPRVKLRLGIRVEGREPYSLEHTETLSRLSVGRLRIGERLPVLVHPQHTGVLRLLWKESVDPAGEAAR